VSYHCKITLDISRLFSEVYWFMS